MTPPAPEPPPDRSWRRLPTDPAAHRVYKIAGVSMILHPTEAADLARTVPIQLATAAEARALFDTYERRGGFAWNTWLEQVLRAHLAELGES